MTILPATYLGSRFPEDCVIDLGERWVKQTARNRCEILTSGGVAALTVPVHASRASGDGAACLTRDVRVDNSKRWQHVHWQSIVSAYRSAPYFEHYAELFEPVFDARRRHEFLVDLDLELLAVVLGILRLPMPKISSEYVVAAAGDIDLRGKKSLRRGDRGTPYTQVFSDRLPFEPGLSIVDLVFNEGPAAREFVS